MKATFWIWLLVPVAYLVGSIPFGLLVGRVKGVDVRTIGSGNIGASNVGRIFGGRYFALVFTLDALKGLIPVALAGYLLHQHNPDWRGYLLWLAVAAAALCGNLFSIFLGFKGGKGVAISTGIALGIYPYFTVPLLGCVAVFLVVLGIWRYISLASMLSAVAFPLLYILIATQRHWDATGRQWPLLVFSILVGGLIVWRHRANIARLRNGTENKVGKKPAAAA